MTPYDADLDLIRSAALAAGALALSERERGVKTWAKDGGSPVTSADIAVDELLKSRLLSARPDYGWLSEETPDNLARLSCERIFVVEQNRDGQLASLLSIETGFPRERLEHVGTFGGLPLSARDVVEGILAALGDRAQPAPDATLPQAAGGTAMTE